MSLAALTKRVAILWVACLLALNYVAAFRIGGITLPDLYFLGASPAEVRAALEAFTPDSREVYLGTYLPLDFLFIVVTVVLALMIARQVAPHLLWLAGVLAVGFAGSDVTEDLVFRSMVLDREVLSCLADCASQFEGLTWATRGKFLCLGALVALLGASWWRERGK